MQNLNEIETNISELLKKEGYFLASLKQRKERQTLILEVVVDSYDPINIEQITNISEKISELLDQIDQTETPYTLDVSSLGAEKPISIETLDKYIERYVNVHLVNPYKGMNSLEGTLKSVTEKEVVIVYKEKTRSIEAVLEKENIDRARLAIKF
ncbi:MAG TPA: hypothetical protein VJY64_00930 [Candidatus Onthovivens sp.]|nr:hypothetical protein [Candidatus Onthovivens sp.]